MYRKPDETSTSTSTLTIEIPRCLRLQINGLEILTGQTKSEIAIEALFQYFEDEGLAKEDAL